MAAQQGGEFRVLRKGSSEWTCLPGPPPGATRDEPGCFDKVFFQWALDGLAGRPQHIERLGIAYMYTGAYVPNWPGETKKQFHVGPQYVHSVHFRDSIGPALEAGVDCHLGKRWYMNAVIVQSFAPEQLDINGGAIIARTQLNLSGVGLGVGYWF